MPSNKSQEAQTGSYRPGGPGLKYRPTSSPKNSSAGMPSRTLGPNPNGHSRGKDGKS